MTAEYKRYAVYFVPGVETSLARLGTNWLGVDLDSGEIYPAPNEWVSAPRKYGFHATLKAPMRLAHGITEDLFLKEVKELAGRLKPVSLGKLELRQLGTFLALMHDRGNYPGISELAWQCVTSLDHLRAPLAEAEINKRSGLNETQSQLLHEWGYPYVGPEFRFHMTLSSSLMAEEMSNARAELEPLVSDIGKTETYVDQLTVLGDPGNSEPFRLVSRFDLKG